MPAPTNTAATTATDIGTALPYNTTQDVYYGGTTYDVWYKYTAQPGDNEIGLYGYGARTGLGASYRPKLTVYLGPASAPVAYLSGFLATEAPVQIPVTPGVTYYFEFIQAVGNPTPAILTLNVQRFTDLIAPAGSIGVNDDNDGFPLVIVSSTTDYLTYRFIQGIPAGEGGAIMTDGTLALTDVSTNKQIKIFDSAYALLATVTMPSGFGSYVADIIGMAQGNDVFYASHTAGSNVLVQSFSKAGVLGSSWTLTAQGAIIGLAPSPDGSILYFIKGGTNQPIRRWDLVNDVVMSNLVAGQGATIQFGGQDILVFSDGSLIVIYRDTSTLREWAVHYDSSGNVLNTYNDFPLGSGAGDIDRLAFATDESTFWAWMKNQFNEGVFIQTNVTTGVVVRTVHHAFYELGVYLDASTVFTPTSRFGISQSCPFWITRTGSSPFTPPDSDLNGPTALVGPNGIARTMSVLRLRRAPHTADEQQQIFYSKFQLDIEAGVGLVTGQGITPELFLRWSNDGGFTWSDPRTLTVGPMGQYRHRCMAFQLGMARDRVFEVSQSDPVKTVWLQAFLDLAAGTW